MHGPATSLSTSVSTAVSAWLLVLLCAASGAYCLRRAGRAGGGPAAGEAAMGFGMALMAVPLRLGGDWQAPVLGVVFCGAALHALWLLRGGPHHAHHLVGSLTMVYMALASGTGAAAGPPATPTGTAPDCRCSPACYSSTTRATWCWAAPGWSRSGARGARAAHSARADPEHPPDRRK